MVYLAPFYRIVMIGNQWGDTFNTTLSMTPVGDFGTIQPDGLDGAELAAVAGNIGTWWNGDSAGTGPRFSSQAILTSVKVNRIDPDGSYRDPVTREHVFPSPIPGGNSTKAFPAQLSVVHTLETGNMRGPAHRGRMYLPPSIYCDVVAADGRMSTASANSSANGLRTLLNQLNTTFATFATSGETVYRVGVASNVGSGRFEQVTKVSVGRVIDTMRARRSSLDEDRYTTAALT